MFIAILILAITFTFLMAYFYLRTGDGDLNTITMKLESMSKAVCEGQEENEFKCQLIHNMNKVDQLDVYPADARGSDSPVLGVVPYEFKSRILHYMNTKSCSYVAVFNKSSERLTIELIEGGVIN